MGRPRRRFSASHVVAVPVPLRSYTPQQLYDVVADVGSYSEFVPWCVESRVLGPALDPKVLGPASGGGARAAAAPAPAPLVLEAELRVGFHALSEAYTSVVTLKPPHGVTSTARGSTLFHHLDCAWAFRPGPLPRTVWLVFSVDFAFRSGLHARAAGLFFDEVAARMVAAFEARCGAVHGPPSVGRERRPA
jgi:ribosome-associated toxin RatA of RatAB toxin-antitoxin module